jgi:hypothetical protein
MAGARKLSAAPVANDPAPARISRRLMPLPFVPVTQTRARCDVAPTTRDHPLRFYCNNVQ